MSSANVVSSISLDPVLKLLSHPGAMRCCLRPVAANEHTAPAPRVTLADVQEPQSAFRTFAFTYKTEVLLTDQVAHRLRDRQQ